MMLLRRSDALQAEEISNQQLDEVHKEGAAALMKAFLAQYRPQHGR